MGTRIKAIWKLITSGSYFLLVDHGEKAASITNINGDLEEVITFTKLVYETYVMLMEEIIEQATDAGELKTAQAFLKALEKDEKRGRH
jgi:hypothetical protein